MNLNQLILTTKETLSQFLDRSYWNASKDVVIIYKNKDHKEVDTIMNTAQARAYGKGLLDDLPKPQPIVYVPKEPQHIDFNPPIQEEWVR